VRRSIKFLSSAALTEEDERRKARHLRELRGRVKAARAVVFRTPGLAEAPTSDRRKSACPFDCP
jgi:hypothetical protein